MSKARDLADSVAAGSVLADGVVSLSEVGGGTNNGVVFVNGGGTTTSGSALTYNGTSFGVGSSSYGDAGSISLSVGVAGTTTGGLQLWSTTTGSHTIQWGDGTSGSDTYRGAIEYAHSGDTMRFYTNGSEVMRLTSTSLYTASGINVGIGTSDPAAPLEVAKNQNAATSIKITNTDSTSNNNSRTTLQLADSGGIKASFTYINAGSAVGTYIGSGGGGNLHLTSGAGVTTATLDSSGNLGLAVAPSAWAPLTAMQVKNAAFSGFSNYAYMSANAYYDGGFKYIASDAAMLYDQTVGAHHWSVAPSWDGTGSNTIPFTQAATLNASGNFLVGTPTDTAGSVTYRNLISTSANTTTTATLGLQYPGIATYGLSVDVNAALTIAKDGAERMRIDSSGNLGLGVAPSAWGGQRAFETQDASFSGRGNTAELMMNAYFDGSNYRYVRTFFASRYQQQDGIHRWAVAPSGTANGAITFNQAMTLDSGGNLIVGKPAATQSGAGTFLYGTGSANAAYFTGSSSNAIFCNREGTDGVVVEFRKDYSPVGTISITTSSTSYNTSSDYRLKEDWVAVADASTRVNALKPVNFAWKVDGSRVDGFLAHELAEVVPEAVTGEKDAVELIDIKDEEGNVTGQEERPVYQGIDQSKLVPLLTAALQEALAQIELLTARVSALEEN
jgi:hypothetical protein